MQMSDISVKRKRRKITWDIAGVGAGFIIDSSCIGILTFALFSISSKTVLANTFSVKTDGIGVAVITDFVYTVRKIE